MQGRIQGRMEIRTGRIIGKERTRVVVIDGPSS